LKTEIADKIGVHSDHIIIWDSRKNEDNTKTYTESIHSKGLFKFKFTKFIVRENLGGRILNFPEGNIDGRTVADWIKLIASKLHIPRYRI
jgi:hypothetical protein